MQNADLEKELTDVVSAADQLRDLLNRSDTLPALPLAEGLIETTRLNAKLQKLSVRLGKVAAPLFGKPPPDDGDGPKRRKK